MSRALSSLAYQSRCAFVLAAAAVTGMLALMLSGDDGTAAIATIAGLPHVASGQIAEGALRFAVFLDTFLPLGYTTAFTTLAIDRADGRTALLACTAALTIAGALFDFLENGAAVFAEPMPAFTAAKYGALGLAAILLGTLVRGPHWIDRLGALMLQIAIPVFIAVLISGIAGTATVWIFAPALIVSLAFGAFVARDLPSSTIRVTS